MTAFVMGIIIGFVAGVVSVCVCVIAVRDCKVDL